MARRKSKSKGFMIMALCAAVGAWFHAPILDKLHSLGIAKNHK